MDRRDGMENRQRRAGKTAGQKPKPWIRCKIANRRRRKRAKGHHTLDTDVIDAGTLCDDAAKRSENQRRGIHQRDIDRQQDVI